MLSVRLFAAPLWLLASAATLTVCGRDNGGAATPDQTESSSADGPSSGGSRSSDASGSSDASDSSGENESDESDRLALTTEFHRTRSAGSGFWVLGVVHNPHDHPVADVQLRVRLLDSVAHVVARTEAPLGRPLGPDEHAAVAVEFGHPVVHEDLVFEATALASDAPMPEPLPLTLTHEPPARADMGGWYVVGTVENTGPTAIDRARIEVHGLDRAGKLLGIDWLVLPIVEIGETYEFDVGDLRYEQAPAKFTVELRAPLN